MKEQLSFWDLISACPIEIPVFQRDYAQGRENTKAEDVRKNLIDKIAKTLRGNDKLFFDFIYGRIETGKNNDENKFIPFDGQQRLTTLFLLHKYVFARCPDSQETQSRLKKLGRFSYATRQSSREFCKELVARNIFPSKGDNSKLSCFIKDQPWFFPDWENDPTISGMLVMLDEIHEKMNSFDNFNDLAAKLISPCCPIIFHFIDIGELELPDDVYVKMNARGKKLTPFENFKASLEEYLNTNASSDNNAKRLLDRIKESIDGNWLDLFWKIANPDANNTKKNLPDSLMLSFVNRHFINVWQLFYKQDNPVKTDPEEQRRLEKIDARINSEKDFPAYPSNDSFVSWDIYEGVLNRCGIKTCLEPIFNTWDALCAVDAFNFSSCQSVWNRTNEHRWDLQEWNPFVGIKVTVDKREKETYPSCVAFYALTRYFAEQDENGTRDELSNWMRVVWNIIENSRIDEEPLYCSALVLIDNLSRHSHDIYNYLAQNRNSILKTNRNDMDSQVIEEAFKAKMINGWGDNILDAEKLPCLRGKINVLFQNGENTSLEIFQQRFGLLSKILDRKEPFFLQKILLSHYEELPPERSKAIDLTENEVKKLLTGILSDCFKQIDENINIVTNSQQWVRDLSQTTLLETARGKWVSLDGSAVVLWGTNGKTWIAQDNIILGKHRELLAEIAEIMGENKQRVSCVKGTKFVAGKDINFQYGDFWFRWLGAPSDEEYDVYLLDGDWRKNPNNEYSTHDQTDEIGDAAEYYCFKVGDMKADGFKDKLDDLIARFKKDEQKKLNNSEAQAAALPTASGEMTN